MSLLILLFWVLKGQFMCDKLRIIRKFQLIGLHKTTAAIKLHFHLVWPRILITWLCRVFLQAQRSLSRYRIGPELFLGLAGPGRTDPDPSFSCSPTEMPSGWCEWLPQQRPGDLQPAGTKVTPPQRFALSLPSFHQPAGELFILYNSEAQIYCTNTTKLHTQFTDIITCNEKINVPAWTAQINKARRCPQMQQEYRSIWT